jgi:hypothetical protein
MTIAAPKDQPLVLHPLKGPFRSAEAYFGCKRFDCWDYNSAARVHRNRSGEDHVYRETNAGFFIDPKSVGMYECSQEVELPATHQWVVEFFSCDVDPPDGTFYEELRGVMICEGTRCSDLHALGGFSLKGAEWGHAPVFRVSPRELVIAGHHLKF